MRAHRASLLARLRLRHPSSASLESLIRCNISWSRRLVALQPRNAKALVGAGVALAGLGRSAEAIDMFRRALELNPNDADAHNNLASTLANEGRIDEALPHFERAVALNPGDVNARRNLEQARASLR